MKTMKNILLLLLLITIPFISFSQEENADAVYNKLTKEYVLNADGTMQFHMYKELKLLTHFSFHRLFGETFIIYDPSYQELKIHRAYTIMADGKRVEAPANAFNEVLPGFARDIPEYNHLREMVVTHTGLEVGATIVLDYTIISRNSLIPYLMGRETIGENAPVKEMEIIAKVPSEVALSHQMLNLRTAPETKTEGQQSVYTWTFRGLKANSLEPYQDHSRTPVLLFSTAKDMAQVYFRFVDQMAFRSMASAIARKSVKELFTNNEDDITKMLTLQDMAVNEVKLANIPFEYTGFKVRQPAETWYEANATSLEKTLLLADWLIQADIHAIPVALIPRAEYDPSMGNLLSFSQFAVQVNPREGDRVYLSVNRKNDQDLVYEMEEYTALQLDGAIESLRTFNEEAAAEHGIGLDGELTLANAEMMTGELTIELEGAKNPYLKLSGKQDAIKTYLSGGLNASDVKDFRVEKLSGQETEMVFTIEKTDPVENTGGYYFLTLPALANGAGQYHLEGLSDSRETPMKLPAGIDEEYAFTITLPAGWKLLTPATELELENPAGTVEIEISQKKDKVVVEKAIEVNRNISEQQYQEFLELVRTWADDRYSRLVLEAGK